ncbi:MAG: rhodanese-like domain-containing protein [Gemmataceae bacterium]
MRKSLGIAVALLALGACTARGQQPIEHTKDDLATVKARVTEGKALLVDVREPQEWKAGHLKDAKSLPLSQIKAGLDAAELAKELPKDKPVYVHCAAGRRCLAAAKTLKELGYDVRPLKPGFSALLEAGFPEAKKD